MDEKVRQQLVDDHFLFMSGDPNLKVHATYDRAFYHLNSFLASS